MGLWFLRLRRGVLALTMIVMVVAVGLGVFFRYFLNAPLFWTDEVARYALVWMTFLGGAELFLDETGHARVDYFINKMSVRARRVCQMVALALVLACLVLMVVGGVVWIESSARAVSTALKIPMPIIYAVIPVSAVGAALVITRRLVALLWRGEQV